jgi:hydroxymethylglutaryl-CoA reductase
MELLMTLLGLSPEQASAALAGLVAVGVFKGIELLLKLLAKLAGRTKTKIDDQLVEAIASAVRAKIK